MRLKQLSMALVLASAMLLNSNSARAETIGFTGLGSAAVVGVSGLTNGLVYAGELNWSWVGAAPAGAAQSFYSYCVDLLNYAQSTQVSTVGTTAGLTGGSYVANAGDKAAWLFNTYASAVHATGQAVQAAALQIAIWEALYDTTASLATGNVRFTASSAILAQAGSYLSSLYSSSYLGSSSTVLFTNGGQDQMTNRVSEPSTMLLLGVGLLVASQIYRRRSTVSAL